MAGYDPDPEGRLAPRDGPVYDAGADSSHGSPCVSTSQPDRSDHAVPVDEALRRLDVIPDYDAGNGPEPCVHTFMQSAIGMLGAHWSVPEVQAFFERHGVEKAGPTATAMHHGLAVNAYEDGRLTTIFFATHPQAVLDEQENP